MLVVRQVFLFQCQGMSPIMSTGHGVNMASASAFGGCWIALTKQVSLPPAQ